MVAAEPLSYGAARRMFEDVLTAANPPWSIHVRIEQSSRLLKGETRLTSLANDRPPPLRWLQDAPAPFVARHRRGGVHRRDVDRFRGAKALHAHDRRPDVEDHALLGLLSHRCALDQEVRPLAVGAPRLAVHG